MGKVLLWLLWAVELLVFVFGAGCVLLIFSEGGLGRGSFSAVALIMIVASVALCGYGVFKAAQTIGRDGGSNLIAIYMLLPVLAVFLFSGSCVIIANS